MGRLTELAGLGLRAARQYGAGDGARLAWHLRGPGAAIREIALPGMRHPFAFRPGTSDVATLDQIFVRRSLDLAGFEQQRVADAVIRGMGAKALILDAGASIGPSSVWFANAYPEATILAVEAAPVNIALLERNAAPYPNIVPIHAALWRRGGKVAIADPAAEPWAIQVAPVDDGAPAGLPVVSVEELLEERPGLVLAAAKFIVEGAETAIVEAMPAWLDASPYVIFKPSDWREPWTGSGHAMFSALGRQPSDYIVKEGNLFCFRRPPTIDGAAGRL